MNNDAAAPTRDATPRRAWILPECRRLAARAAAVDRGQNADDQINFS